MSSKQQQKGYLETIRRLSGESPTPARLQTLKATAQSCQWRFTDADTHAYYQGVIQAIDAYKEAKR